MSFLQHREGGVPLLLWEAWECTLHVLTQQAGRCEARPKVFHVSFLLVSSQCGDDALQIKA